MMSQHGFEAPPIAHIPNLFRGKRITWNDEETKCLIRIAGKIMPTKMRKKQSREIYRTIAYQMNKRGYKKTFEQCRIKWKHLKHFYSVALSVNGHEEKLQVCPYYDELSDAIKDCKKYCSLKSMREGYALNQNKVPEGENSSAMEFLSSHFILNQGITPEVSLDDKSEDETLNSDNSFKLNWKQGSPFNRLLPSFLNDELFSDVSLVCEGRTLKCHKIVLSCYSDYFKELFIANTRNAHPIIVINDTSYKDLKAVINFLYSGEITLHRHQMNGFFEIAKSFAIKGLSQEGLQSLDQDGLSMSECQPRDLYYNTNGMEGSESSVSDSEMNGQSNGVETH